MAELKVDEISQFAIVATNGKDCAFLEQLLPVIPQPISKLVWHTFDDRKMYRPKETISLKGYVRLVELASKDVFESRLIPSNLLTSKIQWKLLDSRSSEISKGEISFNAFGAFELQVALPELTNLGRTTFSFELEKPLNATTPNVPHHHVVDIQEFRRPDFKVDFFFFSLAHLI